MCLLCSKGILKDAYVDQKNQEINEFSVILSKSSFQNVKFYQTVCHKQRVRSPICYFINEPSFCSKKDFVCLY